VLRILQITDTHLYADASGCLLGQNTRQTLELVLELALRKRWPVDRLLLTGDLVHDESGEGYRYLRERIARLDTPCNSLPGNHDAPRVMVDILGEGGVISTAPSVLCGAWNLVFLDSTIPKREGGHLDQSQLDLLRSTLAAHPATHTLICLHHQPIPVGSAWIDTMALDNPGAFFAILDDHPQVRGVIWGHVHQAFRAERNGVELLGTPSTCIQFLPGSEEFAVDAMTPGFRWLDLHPDGRIETGVERITAYPVPMDLTTGGY
jgi:Icc protein